MIDVRRWCKDSLGSRVVETLFETGHLSTVAGVRLQDGREVVVKVRPHQDRIAACVAVQRAVWRARFPCPEPLRGPERVDEWSVTVERFVPGGEQLPREPDSPALFARLLARLVALAPRPDTLPTLEPTPPWIGWDHPGPGLWPVPDDLDADLDARPGPAWLDETAARVRDALGCYDAPAFAGHGDWESQNIRWRRRLPLVVHDWDGIVARPEASLAGAASAVFTCTGAPGAATVGESEAFLDAYRRARGLSWSPEDVSAAWAAGLWVRAFNAKKRIVRGLEPEPDLTETEAADRLSRVV